MKTTQATTTHEEKGPEEKSPEGNHNAHEKSSQQDTYNALR